MSETETAIRNGDLKMYCVRYYDEDGKMVCNKYNNLELAIDNAKQISDSEMYVSLREYNNLRREVFKLKSKLNMIKHLLNV